MGTAALSIAGSPHRSGGIVRCGPLTSAQMRMWLRSYWRGQGEFFPTWTIVWEVPDGICRQAGVEAFAVLTARHEILRTRFVIGPDHTPLQVVFDAATFRPPVCVADESTFQEFLSEPCQLPGGADVPLPPWHARLFTEGEALRHVVLSFDHIVTDHDGLQNWREQFLDLCRDGSASAAAVQPIDYQATEARLREAFRSRAFKAAPGADPLSTVPQTPAPTAIESAADPRWVVVSATFRGMTPLVDLCCRLRFASRPMVVMFAFGWLLSRHCGQRSHLVANYTASRAAADKGVDCRLRVAETPLWIDDAMSFREALRAVCEATLRSYEADIRVDSTRFDERARIIAGRGIGAVVPIFFNFRGVSTPESKALCEPVPVSIIKQSVQPLAVGRPGRLGIDVQVDGDDVMVKLNADTAMLSERVVRLFLETLPTLLEFVALHPEAAVADADAVVPEGFAAHTRCQQVGSSWVNSARIAAVLMSAPGVRDAAVDIEGDEVVASLELASDATLFDVHEHVLANLDRHLDAVAPHVYRRPATGGWWPSDAPVAGWRPLEMDIRLPISTRAERELCNAIEQTHGHRVDNMALTYAAAGGRLLLAPAVVEILRRCGLVGLRSCHFTSAYTLRSVACALHPAATSVVFESYLW